MGTRRDHLRIDPRQDALQVGMIQFLAVTTIFRTGKLFQNLAVSSQRL